MSDFWGGVGMASFVGAMVLFGSHMIVADGHEREIHKLKQAHAASLRCANLDGIQIDDTCFRANAVMD